MMFIHPLFLGKIGLTEILVILLIVVIFFGGKKIPELMRGMGRASGSSRTPWKIPRQTTRRTGKSRPRRRNPGKKPPKKRNKPACPAKNAATRTK